MERIKIINYTEREATGVPVELGREGIFVERLLCAQ